MPTTPQKIAGPGGFIRVELQIPFGVTATANTDLTPIAFPPGACNITYKTITDTAFTAVTDAKMSLGSTAGGVDYVAATTVAAIGVKTHTPVDAAAAFHAGPGALLAYPRLTQSGGSTAVGHATLFIGYSVPVS